MNDAALPLTMIATTKELATACNRLRQAEFVTVDTEFLRESTFWPRLCVVQLADDDGPVLVDALAAGLDLAPLWALMADANVLKVFHSGRQDIEIVWHLAGFVPQPVFDTQVAAMVLGHGDSVSYEQIVHRLAGVQIDKSSRFTDWSRRPLSEAQLAYAAADVTHLRKVYEKLAGQLAKRRRADWLAEEMAVLTSPDTYRQEPAEAWRRIRIRAKKPRDLAVLIELAAWREREAQNRDVPRGRILKDDALGEIALRAPTTVEALGHLRAVPNGLERSRIGADILAAVHRGIERDPATVPPLEPPARPANGTGATVELLKVLLKMVAEHEGVASKVLATVDDLEAIAGDDAAAVGALHGWRRDLFGEKALALKHGRLALAVRKGRVVAVETEAVS